MKRGQIKIAETIGILVIFFLLMVFGVGFFGGVEQKGLKEAEQDAFELRTINVAQMVLFLPEMQCTEQESVDIDCIDVYKLAGFLDNYDDHKLYYFSIFGKSKITLAQTYPIYHNTTLYDNFGSEFTKKLVTNIPVSIYDPVYDVYRFGYLKIEVAQ